MMIGIVSITILIIIMRYSTVYAFDDSFIGVTEFIASAIILPIIFEWIYSNFRLIYSFSKYTASSSLLFDINSRNCWITRASSKFSAPCPKSTKRFLVL